MYRRLRVTHIFPSYYPGGRQRREKSGGWIKNNLIDSEEVYIERKKKKRARGRERVKGG